MLVHNQLIFIKSDIKVNDNAKRTLFFFFFGFGLFSRGTDFSWHLLMGKNVIISPRGLISKWCLKFSCAISINSYDRHVTKPPCAVLKISCGACRGD